MLNAAPGGVAVRLTAAVSALSAVIGLTASVQPASVRTPATAVGQVGLSASEVLIMSGTAMPHVTTEWMDFVSANFIGPTIGEGYVNTPLRTPEQFRPITGRFSLSLNASTRIGWGILNYAVHRLIVPDTIAGTPGDPIAVFGYSQSSWLAAIEKQTLLAERALNPEVPAVSFVLLADPVRPNGGLFSRWFGLGLVRWTPITSAPTGTPFPTYDIARQYDFFADFPAYPLNLLADVNAVFGLVNHDYSPVTLNPADPNYDPETVVQRYGDTTYYLIPSKLPILYPLRRAGLNRAADVIEPVLKVFVELGYDRQAPYGQPTHFKLFPHVSTAELKSDLEVAFAQSREVLNSVPAQGNTLPKADSAPAPAASFEPHAEKAVDINAGTPLDAPSIVGGPVRPARAATGDRGGGQDMPRARAVTRDSGADGARADRRFSRAGST